MSREERGRKEKEMEKSIYEHVYLTA